MNIYDRACAVLNGSARENVIAKMPVFCELARLQALAAQSCPSFCTALTEYDLDAFFAEDTLPFLYPRLTTGVDTNDKAVFLRRDASDELFADTPRDVQAVSPYAKQSGMPYKAWGLAIWLDGEDSIVVVSKLSELIACSYVMYIEDVEYMCEEFIITKETIWFNIRFKE